MAFTKITTSDLSGKGVVGLPDTPQLTTEEMQQKFDELALSVLVPAFNGLVSELGAQSAASNIGISLPEEFEVDSNIAAIINWMLSDISESDQLRHSHANKAVLDLITLAVKLGYDRLVTLFSDITEISDMVKNSADSIPTGKAISEYISELGGGDMLKAVYDTDNSGVVDNSEKLGGQLPSFYQKATDGTLQTEDKTIPGAINEVREMAENGGKNLIGDEFSSTKSYSAGDYAIKDNILYKFTEDKAVGEWDATKVESTTVDNELGGLNAKILWENPDPTVAFGPQSITLNSSDYNYYEIICSFNPDASVALSTKSIKGRGCALQRTAVNTAGMATISYRIVKYISDTELAFDNSLNSSSSGKPTVANTTLVPIHILGYKS